MTLSIIIPYYNTKAYTTELLACLDRQMCPDVEVILVDDGSREPFQADYPWLTIISQENGGASKARNTGLDHASGDYIAFIDSDDLVADNYLPTILGKIEAEQFDYCYISWKTLPGGWNCQVKLNSINDKFPAYNLCVWNRIYKREMIGSIRFNERKKIAEDAQFIREICEKNAKKAFISQFLYFYRSGAEDSLTKRFAEGRVDTERIVYHIPHVTADMKHLIKEFRDADKHAEVILLTRQNDLPELEKYAMVMEPCRVKGTELRGEPTNHFIKITPPEITQVVIYTACTFEIGGIETFIYNFCRHFYRKYDIIVLYDMISNVQLGRLSEFVDVRKNDPKKELKTDVLIVNRITDRPPANIVFNKHVQMVHACKMVDSWEIPAADVTVFVSEAVKKTFPAVSGDEVTINNLTYPVKLDKALILISATRTRTFEKGMKRMTALANVLKRRGVPFIWLVFADGGRINGSPDEMIYMKPTQNIGAYIKAADYLVQLSDAEGFCYSIVEALEAGTAVITTPVEVLPEIGFQDGINGYMVPFEITDDINVEQIAHNVPHGFKYHYDNKKRLDQWKQILGDTKPVRKYDPQKLTKIFCIKRYYDTVLERDVSVGETIKCTEARAQVVINAGFAKGV